MQSILPDEANLGALARWAPEMAAALASLDSDITLLLDTDGTIRGVTTGSRATEAPDRDDWVGRRLADIVTPESRTKIQRLLDDVTSAGVSRRREVNHASPGGESMPVAYTAVRLGADGPVLAVGRDLRAVAAIQQRFVEAQQEMEGQYWKQQQAQSRYRTLFHVATDGVLVLDSASLRVLEANPAASALLGSDVDNLMGNEIGSFLDDRSRDLLEGILREVRSEGRAVERAMRLQKGRELLHVSATPFRGRDGVLLLLRLRRMAMPRGEGENTAGSSAPLGNAVVVADPVGRIVSASREFLDMVGSEREEQVVGQPLSQWLGSPQRSLGEVLDMVRLHGIVREARTMLQSPCGSLQPVEMAAALLTEGDRECIGLTLHALHEDGSNTVARVGASEPDVNDLVSLLGREPLPVLMRQGIGLLERQLVGAALEACGNDMDEAARMLGVTRENLALRLRRQRFALTPGDGDQTQPPGTG